MAEDRRSSLPEQAPAKGTGDPVIGRRLRAARERLNKSQERLGELIGKTKATVSNWEKGIYAIDPDAIPDLSSILALPIHQLMKLPEGTQTLTTKEAAFLELFRALDPGKHDSAFLLLARLTRQELPPPPEG